ncbi:MAG: LuxR C-terminal-related transcriptional regulator [Heliobacteriaceae bacterium]|jgi:DNA-binding NarL/FixJ family response regulator|nr:LuxR C-terminal-related transcriptional regulator [Heliobacteriaceae bacterium]
MKNKKLTEREREVLELLAENQTNQDIAQKLIITSHTVKAHVSSILRKLEVKNRMAAVLLINGINTKNTSINPHRDLIPP